MGKRKQRKFRKKGLPPGTLVYTGDREASPSLISVVRFNEKEYAEHAEYHSNWPNDNNALYWIDVRNLSHAATIERIGNDAQLHPLALEDVLNTSQRAKLEEFDNGLFIVAHHVFMPPGKLELGSEQIAIFMGNHFVVSFQEDPDDTFLAVRKRLQEGVGRLRKKGPDYLAYALLDNIVDNYYLVLDDIETWLLELEAQLHNGSTERAFKASIFDLKHIINQFKHRVMPLRDSVTRFYRTDCPFVDESNRLYLRDLMDHVAQILDNIDNYREILSGIEALYQAEIGNRMNNVMRLLTIISTIFIPLSFMAGLYGMNFDNMPELHWRYGYFFLLGFMLVATLSMLYYFRLKRWI